MTNFNNGRTFSEKEMTADGTETREIKSKMLKSEISKYWFPKVTTIHLTILAAAAAVVTVAELLTVAVVAALPTARSLLSYAWMLLFNCLSLFQASSKTWSDWLDVHVSVMRSLSYISFCRRYYLFREDLRKHKIIMSSY